MITCLQGGCLPAIDVLTSKTQMTESLTLTEVVCVALYGRPLKPGRSGQSLDAACEPLRLEGLALWRNPNGPSYLREHLNLIASGKAWPYAPDTQVENERITLNAFFAAQRWLRRTRRLGFAYGLPPELGEKVIRLAEMSEEDAIAFALSEASRIERAEDEINSKAVAFYRLLSQAIERGELALKAIATDPGTGTWQASRGDPPHQTINSDYFELPFAHDLWDNTLEFNNSDMPQDVAGAVFDRSERMTEACLVRWVDVKIPAKQASALITAFGAQLGVDRQSDPAPRLSGQINAWPPTWLSLAGAIMWVVTRDQALTEKTEAQNGNDCGIVLGIGVRLAQEQLATGTSRTTIVDIDAAWPTLRRLIADERIVAEGRSLERRGMYAAVEQRYPNERIPSGDAANLIILGSVSGIEPKAALGPNELYRFANGQGRYWYDVRLRAADVFREFRDPKGEGQESRKTQSCPGRKREARGDAELLKVAFKQCFPEGVPRGMWVKEVYGRMSEWIKANRDRHPPSWKTFSRQRSKFWPKDS